MRNYSGRRSKQWLINELFDSSTYAEQRKGNPEKLKEELSKMSYSDLLAKYKWLFGEDY